MGVMPCEFGLEDRFMDQWLVLNDFLDSFLVVDELYLAPSGLDLNVSQFSCLVYN